jgi:hypothetical protein
MHEGTVKEQQEASGKPRYSEADASWASTLPQDKFHIVTVRDVNGNIIDTI